eukprot:TRINITY_DN2625_c0_g2_i4.p2 TRINITY_DN2625_c0_g2~~TRINITY_DN2625_c0_g2_i4.p2  ORF type:complete len:141 (-),score=37.14 TRINITY_DN2625_c0_g2_i4:30-452(-)
MDDPLTTPKDATGSNNKGKDVKSNNSSNNKANPNLRKRKENTKPTVVDSEITEEEPIPTKQNPKGVVASPKPNIHKKDDDDDSREDITQVEGEDSGLTKRDIAFMVVRFLAIILGNVFIVHAKPTLILVHFVWILLPTSY